MIRGVEMQLTNKYLDLLPINCLINCHFWIPAYQRGYRWEEQQVKDLLNDLWEFACGSQDYPDAFYCLQPIVVMRRLGFKGQWEVIDGQQRLTTIFIILSFLDHRRPYELDFETRQERCQKFLYDLDNNDSSSIDSHFITAAYDVVKDWFEKTVADQKKFRETLLEKTKVIWYQVEQSDRPIDIFTRLNIGKIPLTNAELIKALLIRKIKEKFRDHYDEANLKELELARAWDRIETALQDENFWAFIYKDKKDSFDTRIDFLFKAVAEDLFGAKPASSTDRYSTFRAFHESLELEGGKSVEDIWAQVEDYFLTLVDWFADRELFHLIGFLVTCGENIWTIRKRAEGKNHREFIEWVKQEKIKGMFKLSLEEMSYEKDDYDETMRALLLFNVLTTLEMKDGARFPFNIYRQIIFSLEHIRPQFPEEIGDRKEQNGWIKEHIEYIQGINKARADEILQEVNNIIGNPDSGLAIPLEKFQEIFTKIENAFEDGSSTEGSSIETVHSIDNLALLDKGTNSSLSNLHFYKKRQRLIEKERDPSSNWIPPCTRNIFMKYYSPNGSSLYFWNRDDRDHYREALQRYLADYLPAQTDGNVHGTH